MPWHQARCLAGGGRPDKRPAPLCCCSKAFPCAPAFVKRPRHTPGPTSLPARPLFLNSRDMASRAAPLAAVLLLLLAGSAAAARNLQQSGPSSSSPYVQALSGFLPFDIIFRTGDFTPSSTLPVGTLVDMSGRPLRYRGSVSGREGQAAAICGRGRQAWGHRHPPWSPCPAVAPSDAALSDEAHGARSCRRRCIQIARGWLTIRMSHFVY